MLTHFEIAENKKTPFAPNGSTAENPAASKGAVVAVSVFADSLAHFPDCGC
jgi:hypothetical protein